MRAYNELTEQLRESPQRWLVTGAAGFIGSNLLESLLKLDQTVVGMDNFSTGHASNLEQVRHLVSAKQWKRFEFREGDLGDADFCVETCRGIDLVLHQGALGSVPRSIESPRDTHDSNVTGFLNILDAARRQEVARFVYASSSSVYGDEPDLPKVEDKVGRCLSPYAATKAMNEMYADVFARCYGMSCAGLRYFNVFGPRQDPNGPYAAVIPKWIAAMIQGEEVRIFGDGETSRDFCFIANVVQANLLAATCDRPAGSHGVYNVALNSRTSLNELFFMIRDLLAPHHAHLSEARPVYRDFRAGDVRHSQADIGRAARDLGYEPTHTVEAGLADSIDWYRGHLAG